MLKLATGTKHQLWLHENPSQLNDLAPFVCKELIVRSESKPKYISFANWSSESGIFIYGKEDAMQNAYQKIYSFMLKKLNTSLKPNEFSSTGSPTTLGLFKSSKYNVWILLGSGYYNKNEKSLIKLLCKLKNVKVGELGDYYCGEDDLFECILENVDNSLKNNKKVFKTDLKILSEMLTEFTDINLKFLKKDFPLVFEKLDKWEKI